MNTAEKLTKLFEKHNPEFRFDPQVSHRWIVNAFDEYTKTASGSVAAPKEESSTIAYAGVMSARLKEYSTTVQGALVRQDLAHVADLLTSMSVRLKEREEALKELLPMAEWKLQSTSDYLANFSETIETEPEKYNECDRLKAIIERASNLISK